MRKLTHWAGWVGGASVLALISIAVLVECADPREDEPVAVVTSCAPDSGVFETRIPGHYCLAWKAGTAGAFVSYHVVVHSSLR